MTDDALRHQRRYASLSWASFHFARDPYGALIVVYLFGPYFATQVIPDPVKGQEIWGYINTLSAIVAAALAPFFGAIADKAGRRKPWIAVFVVATALPLALLWFARPGEQGVAIMLAIVALSVAGTAVSFSVVFHNAMLPSVVAYERLGRVSGIGLALGNVAALLLLVAILYAFALPASGLPGVDWVPEAPLFGLDAAASEPDRIVGPIMAVWLLLFSLPFFLFTPDRGASGLSSVQAVRRGLGDLWQTVRHLRRYKNIAVYLFARMIYNDAVVALFMFSMIYASGLFGWGAAERLIIGIIFTLLAIGGAILGGKLDDRIGSKKTLLITIVGNTIVILVILSITPTTILFIPVDGLDEPLWDLPLLNTRAEVLYLSIALSFAIFVPAAMTASRTMLARIAPPGEITKFYGLYALSGELTVFLGPLLVAVVTGLFASQRAGMASITILLVISFVSMLFVREERGASHDAATATRTGA